MSIYQRMTAAGIDIQKVETESPAEPDNFVLDLGGNGRVCFGPSTTETGEQADGWDIAAYGADGEPTSQDWEPDEAAALAAVARMAGKRA